MRAPWDPGREYKRRVGGGGPSVAAAHHLVRTASAFERQRRDAAEVEARRATADAEAAETELAGVRAEIAAEHGEQRPRYFSIQHQPERTHIADGIDCATESVSTQTLSVLSFNVAKEKQQLDDLFMQGKPPWQVWETDRANSYVAAQLSDDPSVVNKKLPR